MKTITIIGIGTGLATLTKEGLAAIEKAEVLLGASRMLAEFAYFGKPSFPEYQPEKTVKIIEERGESRFAILVSGDVGFYSGAERLSKALSHYHVELIPGISSMNYFFAKLKMPWQDAALLSLHGRQGNLVDWVRRNRLTFALTGGNAGLLAKKLTQTGFGALRVHIGENLGRETERVFSTSAEALETMEIAPLSVMLVENPDADDSIPTGIADNRFLRREIPMTKAEVRAIIMSKLKLSPDDICLDAGAGTGSVTVEMALSAWRGHVYAIDKKMEAIRLVQENCEAFHIGNVTAILRELSGAIRDLPVIDAAFIGGSGGKMKEIIQGLHEKNPAIRIVISAIALESVNAAIQILVEEGFEPEIVQVGVTRSKQAGALHMMLSENPVFIISAGGKDPIIENASKKSSDEKTDGGKHHAEGKNNSGKRLFNEENNGNEQ